MSLAIDRMRNTFLKKRIETFLARQEPLHLTCQDLSQFELDNEFAERVWENIASGLPKEKTQTKARPKRTSWQFSLVLTFAAAIFLGIILNKTELVRNLEPIFSGQSVKDGTAEEDLAPVIPKLHLKLAVVNEHKLPSAAYQNMKIPLGKSLIFSIEAANPFQTKKGYSIPIDLSVITPNGEEHAITSAYLLSSQKAALRAGNSYIAYTPSIPGRYTFVLVATQKKNERGEDHESRFELEVVQP